VKIQNCFQKLYGIINKNGLTLQRVFGEFDAKQGSLTLTQFALLVRKLCPEISEEEIAAGFELIDEDGSDSIEF
jgi:Ca2+-binding EF-hand superfamily protein